jgi:hypothetical protein
MKLEIVIAALLSNLFLFSQKIEIVDSIHGSKLPYALVIDNEVAFYTDKDGVFDIKSIKSDTISIKYLGYKEMRIAKSNLKESVIKLIPDKITLNEVVISNKEKSFTIDYNRKPKNSNSWPLLIGNEILVNILPNEKLKNSEIILLKIKLEKSRFERGNNNNLFATYRINFYDNNRGILYRSIPKEVKTHTKDEIIVEVPENCVILKKEGVWIGLEFLNIENLNNDSEFKTIRPQLTQGISADFTAQSFIQYHFDHKKEMIELNEILKQTGAGEINRNLNISLIVRK